MVTIERVRPDDDVALARWHEVVVRSGGHGRPHATQEPFPALLRSVRDPSPYVERVLLAAVDRDRTVGAAELRLTRLDNLHLAEVELHVRPEDRRRGHGRTLLAEVERLRRAAARTTVLGEVCTPLTGPDQAGPPAAGMAFAEAFGFRSVHREHHLVLPLPVVGAGAGAGAGAGSGAGSGPTYDVLTWGERCPDELVEAYCRMRTQMERDVPAGEVDWEPQVFDEERLRIQEQRLGRSYGVVVAAVRHRPSGELAGYSLLLLPHGDREVLQEDTLVMPGHRGHGLGRRLKQATLEVVQRDHPERRALHTWTDPANLPMYRTNESFGYRAVEELHEMQRVDAEAGRPGGGSGSAG